MISHYSPSPYYTQSSHTNATQRNAKQCNATQCNATQCNAMQRNATQCNATQCNATQRNATQPNATQRNPTQRNNPVCHVPTTVHISRSHSLHHRSRHDPTGPVVCMVPPLSVVVSSSDVPSPSRCTCLVEEPRRRAKSLVESRP